VVEVVEVVEVVVVVEVVGEARELLKVQSEMVTQH